MAFPNPNYKEKVWYINMRITVWSLHWFIEILERAASVRSTSPEAA